MLPLLEQMTAIGYMKLSDKKSRSYWLVVDAATTHIIESHPPLYVGPATSSILLNDLIADPVSSDMVADLRANRVAKVGYSLESLTFDLNMRLHR